MEAALINSVVGLVVTKLHRMIEEDKKLRDDLKKALLDIKLEMQMMNKTIVKYGESKDHRPWILELQELAYDVEDCIDLFEEKVTYEPRAPWYRRKFHQAKTVDIRTQFAEELKGLKERVLGAFARKDRHLGNAAPAAEQERGASTPTSYTPEAELVGIEKPKAELLELLREAAEGEAEQLRVVSILGPRGMGKTTLARAVYDDDDVARRFPRRAWVVASEHRDANGLLEDILRQVQAGEGAVPSTSSSCDANLFQNIKRHLQANKRYLVVIDDVQTSLWDMIKSSFPDKDTNGRIIVTTSIQSIANTCSTSGAYVYRMQALNKDCSEALLYKRVFGSQTSCSADFKIGSESIVKKCDGLPLGLVNIAQFLREKGSEQLNRVHCKDVCSNLGSYMQSNHALARMKQVLIHSYDNLPRPDQKTCLLSVSIYPKGQPIKRKSLVRRWLAEGFVVRDVRRKDQDVACEHFEELINRSIIQPVDISNNAGVKTCQLHGIMLDFIVHKSTSENFITLIHNDEVIPNTRANCAVRRLSLYKPTEQGGRAAMEIDISRIRSLTIFEHVGQSLVDFDKCKLLRALDLEKCKLTERDLDSICKLLQLKYLSLRGTDVSKLPREISKLHHLETLDIRGTGVNILPKEVLNLPQLTHLFGQFKLPCELSRAGTRGNPRTFFSEDSKLQTLAGFVMDENRSFQQIMLNMSKLRKVKIWADSTPPSREITDLLVSSLKKQFISANPLESLSIDFGGHPIDFLDSLDAASCALTSIKLHGKLTRLPTFVTSLHELLELHLLSTGLDSEALSKLQHLHLLLYLKLFEDRPEFGNGSFIVEREGFLSLQRLRIQAQKLPQMSIAEGAMQRLYSLQLICEDISGIQENEIKCFDGLKEVTLATTVSANTRKSWEEAAKQHKNRPIIM